MNDRENSSVKWLIVFFFAKVKVYNLADIEVYRRRLTGNRNLVYGVKKCFLRNKRF